MARTISSLEGMRSLFAEANDFPTGSFEGPVVVVSVDKLSHAGGMVQLMDSLISQGWQFELEGEVVLRRLARADALLVHIADEPLRVFLNNPRSPNVVKDLRRVGWKLNRASKMYGDRGRARTPGVPVPRQPMLNRVSNTLRRLAGHASKNTKRSKPIEYIERRIRLLREEVIPACRASSVLVQAPLPPPLPQPSPLPPPRPQPSSSPTSTGSTSSTSTARASTPSTAGGSSSWSDDSYNSNCSRCVEGRPHGNFQIPFYSSSSSSTGPSSGSSGEHDL